MSRKTRFILVGLAVLTLAFSRTARDSSPEPPFHINPTLPMRIAEPAIDPVESHLAWIGFGTGALPGSIETRAVAKLSGSSSKKTTPAANSVPEDLDWGVERDQIIEGGELVAETVNLLNGNALETRLDLCFPSANRMGLPFLAACNSRSNIASTLGFGWSHTYSVKLTPPAEGEPNLKIIDETGRAYY